MAVCILHADVQVGAVNPARAYLHFRAALSSCWARVLVGRGRRRKLRAGLPGFGATDQFGALPRKVHQSDASARGQERLASAGRRREAAQRRGLRWSSASAANNCTRQCGHAHGALSAFKPPPPPNPPRVGGGGGVGGGDSTVAVQVWTNAHLV